MSRALVLIAATLLLSGCYGDNPTGFHWDFDTKPHPAQVDAKKVTQQFIASITRDGWILPLMERYKVSGSFSAANVGNEYRLEVALDPLPYLEEGHRLRTWLVLQDPYEFIETGPLVQENGKLVDRFTTAEDVSRFNRYEVTAYHEKYGDVDRGYPIAIRLFDWERAPQ